MKIIDTYDCKIPTWALSALINDDYSGIEDNPQDIEYIRAFIAKFDRRVENHQAHSWVLSIDSNENDYKLLAENFIEDLSYEIGEENGNSGLNLYYWQKRLVNLNILKMRRMQEKESYFSSIPEFGLAGDVQDCTISILE